MRCALFCSKGLGDGLIFLLIANNLKKNGIEVEIFHDFLFDLYPNFLDFKIFPYPDKITLKKRMGLYDLVIINTDDREINIETQRIAKDLKIKNYLIHATTCKRAPIGSYPLDRNKTLVENLFCFCKEELKLEKVKKDNGITPLKLFNKYNRIVIHPTSTNEKRNWPLEKYIKLSQELKKIGFKISFILTKDEIGKHLHLRDLGIEIPVLKDLNEVASYIYESRAMIGNDSGIGHLASSLKVPTFTIFTSFRKKAFWKPDFFLSDGIAPLSILPKWFKLRERYWKQLISTKSVYKKFLAFLDRCER